MFLTVDALAKEIGIHPESLRNLARSHKIPAGKVGGSWVFIREDIENMIRGVYDESVRVDSHQSIGDQLCESIPDQESSFMTSTCRNNPEIVKTDEYEELLTSSQGRKKQH